MYIIIVFCVMAILRSTATKTLFIVEVLLKLEKN